MDFNDNLQGFLHQIIIELNIFYSLLGQYEMGECVRSGFCNFMHLKPISRELRRELYGRRGAQSGLGNHGRNKVSKAKLYLINNLFKWTSC